MTKNFLTGFEREKTGQSKKESLKVCHSCLAGRMQEWLGFYPNLKKQMAPKIKRYASQMDKEAAGNLLCSVCSSKKAALCPCCFTEAVLGMLKQNNTDKMVMMDFLSSFNFDLHEDTIAGTIK